MPNMLCEKCNAIVWHKDTTRRRSPKETFRCTKCNRTKKYERTLYGYNYR